MALSRQPGETLASAVIRVGSKVSSPRSVMQMVRLRLAASGINRLSRASPLRASAAISRTVVESSSARVVGAMPVALRTNSGSSKKSRSRARAWLTALWLTCIWAAVLLT